MAAANRFCKTVLMPGVLFPYFYYRGHREEA